MVFITLKDIIGLVLLGLIIIGIVIYLIVCGFKWLINRIFKKNCYKCKNWYLSGIASCGGIAYHKCKKECLKNEIRQECNERNHYVFCDKYEEKTEEK